MKNLRVSSLAVVSLLALGGSASVLADPPAIDDNRGIPGQLAALAEQIDVLESQLTSQDVTIETLKATTTTLEAARATLEAANTELQATVDALETRSLVARTGQTGCWSQAGTSVTCFGSRQDGELQPGVAWPSPRFTDNGDGTVSDNLTGLVWLKDASGSCFEADDSADVLWDHAVAAPFFLTSGSCGLSDGSTLGDWRLPSARELFSLVDLGRTNPALPPGHPFSGVTTTIGYWSSTTFAGSNFATADLVTRDTSDAWGVGFLGGVMSPNHKELTSRVWPVRDPF